MEIFKFKTKDFDRSSGVMISNSILWDMSSLLKENGFKDFDWITLPEKPSPWDVTFILIKMSNYVKSLVFFDHILYINKLSRLEILNPYSTTLYEHLNKFTDTNPIIEIVFDDDQCLIVPKEVYKKYGWTSDDQELAKLYVNHLCNRKGFVNLSKESKFYYDLEDKDYLLEFASSSISEYCISQKLGIDYLSDAFESLLISYDVAKRNLERSFPSESVNIAKRFAIGVIDEQATSTMDKDMEFVNAFKITFPPVFILALMESKNFSEFFRVIFELRDYAKNFRKTMKRLDKKKATRMNVIEILKELDDDEHSFRKIVGMFSKYVSIGPGFFIFSLGMPASDLLPRNKRVYFDRLSKILYDPKLISEKIELIFKNSGHEVSGIEVLNCLNDFMLIDN